MQIEQLIASIKNRQTDLLIQAINAKMNLNCHDPVTGQSIANIVIELNDEAIISLLFGYSDFDWNLGNRTETSADLKATANDYHDEVETVALATSGQARLWAQQYLLPADNQAVYHIPVALPLTGPCNTAAIKQALAMLQKKHDVLRSAFTQMQDELLINVNDNIELPLLTVEHAEHDPQLAEFYKSHYYQTFDLSAGPLWRVALIKHSADKALLFFVYHHIIVDGDSLDILVNDFANFYNLTAENISMDEKPSANHFIHYAKQKLIPDEKALNYWQTNLAEFPEITQPLPDKRRPEFSSYQGRNVAFSLHLPETITTICEFYQVSLNSLMFGIYNLLLYKLTDQKDLIIGTPTSARSLPNLSDVAGYFLDTLPIRSQLQPSQRVSEFIQQASLNRSQAYANQAVDFPTILKNLELKQNPALSPLFQCFFIMMAEHNESHIKLNGLAPIPSLTGRGLTFDLFPQNTAKYDLSLRIDQVDKILECNFEYSTDCYTEESITNFIEFFKRIFSQIQLCDHTLKCEDLTITDSSELTTVFPEPVKPSAVCLFSILAAHAKYRPNLVALSDENETITYKDLYQRVSHLALTLTKQVADVNPVIAVAMPRSCQLVIAQLAVMAIGGAYVPLDVNHPPDRWHKILKQAKPHIIMTPNALPQLALKQFVFNQYKFIPCASAITSSHTRGRPAYIMFTSGSSGEPKGIAVSYQALIDFLISCQQVLPLTQQDRWASVTNPCFDISGYEYYGPLLVGASCHIVDSVSVQDGTLLTRQLNQIKPTVVQATPATWEMISLTNWRPEHDFRGICGGERLPDKVYDFFIQSQGRFYNFYGPTEATIWATYSEIRQVTKPNNIGKSLPHMQAYVLDKQRKLLPIGVPGELYLAGSGLAIGYWQDEEKTNKAFCYVDYLPKQRLYQTGDKVRLMSDGSIEYLARFDDQIKLNGYRIELGEIEVHLATYSSVDNCVVLRLEGEAEPELVACIQTKSSKLLSSEIENHLLKHIPKYMVPSRFLFFDKFPTNNRGKIDRSRLAKEVQNMKTVAVTAVLPINDSAQWLLDYLTNTIKNKLDQTILYKTNFHDLGLSSKDIIRLANTYKQAFQTDIQTTWFYQHPTVELFCRFLETKQAKAVVPTTVHIKADQEALAIIGMSCRFPGASNADNFWKMLVAGQSGLHNYSAEELRQLNIPEAIIKNPRYVPVVGRLDQISMFDAGFFGFTPKDAALTSPSQRLFLETVWHALEDANLTYDIAANNNKVALFAACGDNDYFIGGYQDQTHFQGMLGTEKDYLATRVAYKLNLTGPALSVQTACSSSLVALHLAANSLKSGEAKIAVAGGVSIIPVKEGGYFANDGFMFSPDGRCAPFSNAANGIIATHGVGAIVLKPLAQAKLDGDFIYAVYKGSAINNDGNIKAGYTAPSPDQQAAVINHALQQANIDPDTISYIEAHGTGTALGDPIEVAGLTQVFGHEQAEKIALGSVKSNIGHTTTAAGIAGAIKATLALKHKIIPASLHAETTNPDINFNQSAFSVQTKTAAWNTAKLPRRTGISSFGIGGTNAHAILEEAQIDSSSVTERLADQWQSVTNCQPPALPSLDDGKQIILLSAKTKSALAKQVANYREFLQTQSTLSLADLAYTLSVGREHMQHRLALTTDTVADAIAQLGAVNLAILPETSLIYHAEFLQACELDQFALWYQHDAFYRALVDSCATSFSSLAGLGQLATAIKQNQHSEQGQRALSIVYLYSALRRYQSCGITTELLVNNALSELLTSLLAGAELANILRQALLQPSSVTIAVIYTAVISLTGAQRSFQQALSVAYQQGQAIDWRGYWRGSIRQKIRVPLYPFERKHYWLDKTLLPTASSVLAASLATGLLGAGPITNEDQGFVYQQELDIDSGAQSYLTDHRVLASCVFPGAGYSELLLSAARRLDMTAAIEVLALSYQEPMQLNQGEIRLCQVKLTPVVTQTTGVTYQAVIKSWVKGTAYATAITHAQGEVRLAPLLAPQQPQIDLGRMQRQYVNPQAVETIYAQLANDGVRYDHYFRGVQEFSLNAQQSKGFAKLQLDSALSTTGHSVHPVLLDSAFQTLAGLLLLNKSVPPEMTYIPVGHGKLHYYSEVGSVAYAQVNSHSATLSAEMTGDIAVYNEMGKLALLVNGLQLKQIPKALLQQRLNPAPEKQLTYRRQWEARSLATIQASEKRSWLIVGGDTKLSQALSNQLAQQGEQALTVPATAEALAEDAKALSGPVGIIYLASLLAMPMGPINNPAQVLGQQQISAAWNLIAIAQALGKSALTITRFLVLTEQAINAGHGMYSGLTTSLAAAKNHWQVSLLDIDDSQRADVPELMVNEALQTTETELLVSYRQANRYVARLQQDSSFMQTPSAALLFKPHESCLVTGGLGGIGLRLTEWLVGKGAKNIVLMSRRPRLPEPAQIDSWRNTGIKIDIETIDVSHRDSLAPVFTRLRAEERPLAGIFHLAGVIRDKLIDNLTAEDVHEVFAAKVLSGYYLHELSLVEPQIRYFVLFSSLVAIIGSPGQVNYAAANSALDSLAEYRAAQGLPSQRINFGAWAEVGMAAELSEAQRQRGLEQISVKEGLQAVESSLRISNSNVIVARVNWEKIWRGRNQLGLITHLNHNAKRNEKMAQTLWLQLSNTAPSHYEVMIQDYLIKQVHSHTGHDLEKIRENIDEGFTNFSIGSLEMGEIKQNIQNELTNHCELDGELLIDYPSIRKLATYLTQMISPILMQNNNADESQKILEWINDITRVKKLSSVQNALIKANLNIVSVFVKNGKAIADAALPATVLAALSAQPKIMDYVVGLGWDVNAAVTDKPFITALSIAVVQASESLVDCLLLAKATITDEILALNTSASISEKLQAARQQTSLKVKRR